TWRPWWQGVLYMFILGAAVRFIHFALFDGTLLSLPAYGLDTAVAIGCAASGFRITRARQMVRQYGFLSTSPLPTLPCERGRVGKGRRQSAARRRNRRHSCRKSRNQIGDQNKGERQCGSKVWEQRSV